MPGRQLLLDLSGRWGLTRWGAVGALTLLLSGGVPVRDASAQTMAGPLQSGAARIWFYRNYEPYGSPNYTSVSLNGAAVGYVDPGGAVFYRDVAPGRYHVTVATEVQDVNQGSTVDLAPGQQAFVKITDLNLWETGGDKNVYTADAFYARLVPEQLAAAEISAVRPGN